MVTFKPVGRLGNFLFEAASALAYSYEHNIECHIPTTTNDAFWNPTYLGHLANPRFNPELPQIVIKEQCFTHHYRQFNPDWDDGHNILLDGYWQTEKYFKHFRERILDAFAFPWEPLPKVVSVHVRRGDYLKIKRGGMLKHPPVTDAWYQAQMRKFPGHQFVFFSDDMEYCQRTFGHLPGVMMGVIHAFKQDDRPEVRDLISMSCYEHHICSASTFSWWGAWLNRNPNKRVIMPKHWITPEWSNLDCSDVVPANWERC